MSRIRTVKPELFRHEDLFDAELASGLPLRLAFIGLFTVADCEGRFMWKPRTLKLDVLPHDIVDFAAVLNALERAGFIERYEVNGEPYGVIPSFTRHQIFQTKEQVRGSQLPPPPQRSEFRNATGTVPEPSRNDTGTVPESQEREKEREREEEGRVSPPPAATRTPSRKTACPAGLAITAELQAWATAHGYVEDLTLHLDHFRDKATAKGYQYSDWDAALRNAIRDDWAGLRLPGAPKKNRPSAKASDPRITEVETILAGIRRPVIEGEFHVA